MKKSILLLILPALLLSSCGSSKEERMTVNYTLAPSLRNADSKKTGGYNLTFKMDLKVIFKTIKVVLCREGITDGKTQTMTFLYDERKKKVCKKK